MGDPLRKDEGLPQGLTGRFAWTSNAYLPRQHGASDAFFISLWCQINVNFGPHATLPNITFRTLLIRFQSLVEVLDNRSKAS